MAAALVLAEPGGGFITEWHRPPPPAGALFTVIREEWTEDHGYPVRRIYEARLAGPVPAVP